MVKVNNLTYIEKYNVHEKNNLYYTEFVHTPILRPRFGNLFLLISLTCRCKLIGNGRNKNLRLIILCLFRVYTPFINITQNIGNI